MKLKKNTSCQFSWMILLTILIACSRSSAPENDSAFYQEEEVKSTLNAMWAAIENEDIELYSSFIHPEFTQFGESDPELLIGKEAEISGTREWLKSASNIHTEMVEPRVVIKGNVAWISYYWNDRGTTNGQAFSSRGKSTRIFVKEKGLWLCIHGHYTLLP